MKLLPRDCPITYAQQYRRCGDIHCKCYKGQRHGPYWYAFYYDRQAHRCTCVYIGKTLAMRRWKE